MFYGPSVVSPMTDKPARSGSRTALTIWSAIVIVCALLAMPDVAPRPTLPEWAVFWLLVWFVPVVVSVAIERLLAASGLHAELSDDEAKPECTCGCHSSNHIHVVPCSCPCLKCGVPMPHGQLHVCTATRQAGVEPAL